MTTRRLTYSAALGLALAALTVPASASVQDLRTADARENDTITPAAQDARSPDARTPVQSAQVTGADLRTPDTRDAAEGRGTHSAPDVMVVKIDKPAPAPVPAADGMDWGDAGIGAGVLAGLAALALGAALVTMRRRHAATPA
jgi:hypothetical protein